MTKDQIKELHEILVSTIIKYINDNKITDLEEVEFNADCLQGSATKGEWQPCTDSYLGCSGYRSLELTEPSLNTRYLIGESF